MVKKKEYLLSFNKFNEPEVLYDKQAVGLLLLRLITMDPGTDPLHPDMGVGIKRYRYAMDIEETLARKIEDQIDTYLPYFSDATINLSFGQDHTLNIEITMDDIVYIYESDIKKNNKDITLKDISLN